MNKYLDIKRYKTYFINNIINLLSPLIKILEYPFIMNYSNKKLAYEPVFIIGAPRTGSTILYQILTNQLDVIYIDNLVCKFYKNLFFGFWLSKKRFNNRAHNCFKSNYGNTSVYGGNAPSECGDFWYRWFPSDRHFIDVDEIDEGIIVEIRKELTSIINYHKKPIVFKNLNAGQRLRVLKKIFPNAKFIYITREPIFTAQSILKAKRKEGIADNEYWSIKSRNFKELEKLTYNEQIVKQIYYLQKQILEDKKLFNDDSFLTIDYQELGKDFDSKVKLCREFIGVKNKLDYKKADVKLTEKLSLKSSEVKALKREIDKLDWNEYNE